MLSATGTDLAVLGTGPTACAGGPCYLHPVNSFLTTLTPPYNTPADANIGGNPLFLASYFNGGRSALTPFGFTTDIQMAPAFDEGGNFIDVRFGPLTLNNPTNGNALFGNYAIQTTSPAVNAGLNSAANSNAALNFDYFGNPRPANNTNRADIGAVEAR